MNGKPGRPIFFLAIALLSYITIAVAALWHKQLSWAVARPLVIYSAIFVLFGLSWAFGLARLVWIINRSPFALFGWIKGAWVREGPSGETSPPLFFGCLFQPLVYSLVVPLLFGGVGSLVALRFASGPNWLDYSTTVISLGILIGVFETIAVIGIPSIVYVIRVMATRFDHSAVAPGLQTKK